MMVMAMCLFAEKRKSFKANQNLISTSARARLHRKSSCLAMPADGLGRISRTRLLTVKKHSLVAFCIRAVASAAGATG